MHAASLFPHLVRRRGVHADRGIPLAPHRQEGIEHCVSLPVFAHVSVCHREHGLFATHRRRIRLLGIKYGALLVVFAQGNACQSSVGVRHVDRLRTQLFSGLLQVHLRTVQVHRDIFVVAQEISQDGRADGIRIILMFQELMSAVTILLGNSRHHADNNLLGNLIRRHDRIGNCTGFGNTLLQNQDLHHLQQHSPVPIRSITRLKQIHQGGVLVHLDKQRELALEQRGHVVHLREQKVVNADQFLLVLHDFQEQAIIVKQRHILVVRGIEPQVEILPSGIGRTILHVQMGKQRILAGKLFSFQAVRLLRIDQGERIVAAHRDPVGDFKTQVAVAGVGFIGLHHQRIGHVVGAAHFKIHSLQVRRMGDIQILRILRGIGLRSIIFLLHSGSGSFGSGTIGLFCRRRTARIHQEDACRKRQKSSEQSLHKFS